MFSKLVYWRKVCVLAWLICHDRVVAGLEFIPLSPSSPLLDTLSLTQRASIRPDASCPVKDHHACGNGTPDYFCCPSDKACVVVASNTTALCCPRGASCDAISTIICDISAQDVLQNPDSPIHTTNLRNPLPVCGNRCCPFGYKCRGGSACVLDKAEEPGTTSSSDITTSTTKRIPFVGSVPATVTENTASGFWATPTPSSSVSRIREVSTPTATAPSASTAATAPENRTTSGGVIAGTTLAAVASVAGLTCLLWFKRRSISEKVGSAKFARPWQQIRPTSYGQDAPLPRYNSPPPAYNMQMKPPAQHQHVFKHYSPDSVGSDPPVELPATPVSFSMWNPRSPRVGREPRRPPSHYEPYRRPA